MPISAEVVTLTLSGFMSGYYFSGAWVFTPAVIKAPPPLIAQQWRRAWDVGRYVGKFIVTSTAVSFTYLAYSEPAKFGNPRFQLLALAAGLVGSIVPFTIISSYPFNEAINERLGGVHGEIKASTDGKDLKQMVVDWGRLDYYRTLLALSGTLVGVTAILM
ncbi:hypothetical protein F4680DRAFT_415991 [Xylaria scruposa]|nr:hypothetical protein F4680DRAFT_415991 [Xylaria scruposa]